MTNGASLLRVRGTICQTPTPGTLEVLLDHVVTAGDDGRIASVAPATSDQPVDVHLPDSSVLLPGLIDLHIHAPQWPQLGTGLDLPLEQWLWEHTFPLEARYDDVDFAERVWASLVPGLLGAGTTTAVYFSSTHEEATLALARACVEHGQRAFVGRVAMDHPDGTPEWYRDSDDLAASARSVEAIDALGSELVRPAITPRFIPACTDALLAGLGELAAATGALVQTHCSESDWEHGYVLDRFGTTDTVALERFGLARPHTVLAHGDHLTADDQAIVADLNAGVAHCPLSNSYFANAVFPVRAALDRGLRVGLGSDVAGGAEPGLLAQCAHAVTVSRMLEDGVDPAVQPAHRGVPQSSIDVPTAFWLATRGGANVLGIPAGYLAADQVFDAFVVDTGNGRTVEVWPEVDDWPRIFEKVIRRAHANDVTHLWVTSSAQRLSP